MTEENQLQPTVLAIFGGTGDLAWRKLVPALFVDIGGVLLTNGWDHHARKRAATNFKLDWAEMEERHHLTFDTYEEGKLTLEQYLGRVVFHRKRPFTRARFRSFMFAQSEPYSEMIELVRTLKAKYQLKIVVVSNEGCELNAYRIRKFKPARPMSCCWRGRCCVTPIGPSMPPKPCA